MLFFRTGRLFWFFLLLATLALVGCGGGGDDDDDDRADDDDTDDGDDDDDVTPGDDDDDTTGDDDDDDDDDVAEPVFSFLGGGGGQNGLDALIYDGISYVVAAAGRELTLYAGSAKAAWAETFIASDAEFPAVAVDGNGIFHIVYQLSDRGGFAYATNSSGAWVETVLGALAESIDSIDITVTSDDVPVMAFYNEQTESVGYGTYDGIQWEQGQIATTGVFGGFVALTADAVGNAHLAYYDSGLGVLRYTKFDGESWSAPETVDGSGDAGFYPSIAVDDSGFVYIAYQNFVSVKTQMATNATGDWAATEVDSQPGTGIDTSIGFSNTGDLYISYINCEEGVSCQPRLATLADKAWNIVDAAPMTDNASFTKLIFDAAGVHLAYYAELGGVDLPYGQLTLLSENGLGFDSEAVSTAPGYWPSVASSDAGVEAVSFHDPMTGELFVATPAGGFWDSRLIDDGDVGGKGGAIAATADGLHLCYHHEPGGELSYATNVDGAWEIEDLGVEGRSCAIAVDELGTIAILAADESAGLLSLNLKTEEGWENSTVGNISTVGGYINLAFDGQGYLHATYYFGEVTFDVRYGNNTDGTWNFESVADVGEFGTSIPLAMDSQGNPHFVYADGPFYSAATLHYATRQGSGDWQITEINSQTGLYPALVLDDFDDVHVAFFDWQNADLRYATNGSGSWETVTIDSLGDAGYFTQMSYGDDNNEIAIAYLAEGGLYVVNFPMSWDWEG
jgi:hypothetical protein